MLTEVRIKGFKGRETVQSLSGRDIICGSNGSGKSSRAQAIETAILGYVPGNGKTAADTFKLASESKMTVGLTTSDGFTFDRSLEKKTKTKKNGAIEIKIEQELSVSPSKGEKTSTDKETRIAEELGNFPCMLDFDEFLSLSDLKRREFIYNLSATEGNMLTKDGIAAKLKEQLLTDELQENNAEMYQVMAETIDECLGEYTDDADVQSGLQAMHDYAKAQLSYWKKELEKASGASQKIAAYKNELQETDRNLEKNQQAIAQLQKDLTDASVTLASAKERNSALEDAARKISQLQNEITAIQAQKPARTPEEVTKDIHSYESDMAVAVDHSEEIAKLNDCLLKGRAFIDSQGEERNKWWVTAGTLKTNIKIMEDQIASIEHQSGVCVIDKHIRCVKDFSKYIEHLKDEIAKARQDMEEAETSKTNTEAIIEKAKAKIHATEQRITALRNEESDSLRKNSEIERILRELQTELATVSNFDSVKGEKIKAREAEIQRIREGFSGQNEDTQPSDLTEFTDAVDSLKVQIEEMQAKISEQQRARTTLTNLKNSLIDSKMAEYKRNCWKQIADSVGPGGLQGEIVKSILGPIQADIQRKLTDMQLDREFFFETSSDKGKEVFQFGWINENGTRVYFDALSTGEQMLLMIAFMTTIIERKSPKLKMLVIDNLNHLDHENVQKVIAGLEAAGKNLDNIILLGVIDIDPKKVNGWQVCDLDTEGAELLRKRA